MRQVLRDLGTTDKILELFVFFNKWMRKYCFIVILPIVFFTGCNGFDAPDETLVDAPLSASGEMLLRISFDAVSAMPVDPLVKDRSRTQERVVDACLELDQPLMALGFIKQIENWRRGMGYANYSFYSVKQGVTNQVDSFLKEADRIAWTAKQEWRRDEVLERIQDVRLLLNGDLKVQQQIESNTAGAFEKRFRDMETCAAEKDFDHLKTAMELGTSLYRDIYNTEEFRGKVAEKLVEVRSQLPVFLRLEYMQRMVRVAVDYQDFGTAKDIAKQMQRLISDHSWPGEYHVRALAALANVFALVGEVDSGEHILRKARSVYEENREAIVNIDRADTLIPVAEAALAMQMSDIAKEIYVTALHESLENPNSRPRADDLSLIATSMALQRFDVDDALMAQMKGILDNLDHPW